MRPAEVADRTASISIRYKIKSDWGGLHEDDDEYSVISIRFINMFFYIKDLDRQLIPKFLKLA